MKKIALFILAIISVARMNVSGQMSINLTFTAKSNGQHVSLDSVQIANMTNGTSLTLHAPDTVLHLYLVGIDDPNLAVNKSFTAYQNAPNPFSDKTKINFNLSQAGKLSMGIYNLLGQKLNSFTGHLHEGMHTFEFSAGTNAIYILSATLNNEAVYLKMLRVGRPTNQKTSLIYQGMNPEQPKEIKRNLAFTDSSFNIGDQLRFTGYAQTTEGYLGSDVLFDVMQGSQLHYFMISPGLPCPGASAVSYLGKNYKTVKIGNQCWFKENLNVGNMLVGGSNQTNNNIIEKYCYNNLSTDCNMFGGLYQWDEMMNYVTTQGAQGICPSGWHVPTEAEFNTLFTFLGGTSVAGGKMKTTGTLSGTGLWFVPNTGATNSSGFSCNPGGDYMGSFQEKYRYSKIWTSSSISSSYRIIQNDYNSAAVSIGISPASHARSVRCVKEAGMTVVPSTPSNLTATSSSMVQISLLWTDNANNEQGYIIERAISGSPVFDVLITLPANTTNYTNVGLSASTTYSYRVKAYNSAGNSGYSNIATATTIAATVPTISAPSTSTGAFTIVMGYPFSGSLQSPSDGYRLEESTSPTSGFTTIWTEYTRATSFSKVLTRPTGTYYFRTRVYDVNHFSPYSNVICVSVNGAAQKATLRIQNNTHYDIIDMKLNGTQYITTTGTGIGIGNHIDIDFNNSGTVNYELGVGFWDGNIRDTWFYLSGSATLTVGTTTTVTYNNPTIGQLLSGFSSYRNWDGEYWMNLNMYIARYKFTNTGGWTLYDNGITVGTGSVSLVSWPNYAMTVTFKLCPSCSTILLPYPFCSFFYNNGPSSWPVIEYVAQ